MSERFTIMDIGHRGLPLDEALTELETAVSDCIFYGKVRAIKVIHGHGSGALKRGVREVVQKSDWSFPSRNLWRKLCSF